MHVFRCRTLPLSYDYYTIFHRFSQRLLIEDTGLTHENLYSSKNNHYRKKSAALPAAALPFAAADRNRNRTAQSLFTKRLLAIPCSTALQKMSIFENAALVCESAHVYTQVCFANLQLNGTRYFSVPFKLGQSGSAAVPLPRVPTFLCKYALLF